MINSSAYQRALTDRWIFRLGAIAAVVGSLIAGIGNLFHPITPLGNPEGVALTIA